MRGKADNSLAEQFFCGITPAHAGKRTAQGYARCTRKDHLRPCGEKLSFDAYSAQLRGSPPPMRGKGLYLAFIFPTGRITPAHAGKSFVCSMADLFGEDHPRPCGEKPNDNPIRQFDVGSPPPMRGKENPSAGIGASKRITPAHAGKRDVAAERAGGREDHPRPCGEKRSHARLYASR